MYLRVAKLMPMGVEKIYGRQAARMAYFHCKSVAVKARLLGFWYLITLQKSYGEQDCFLLVRNKRNLMCNITR